MKLKQLYKKIDSLGERNKTLHKERMQETHKLDKLNFNFPVLYNELSEKYGSFSFENPILVKSIDEIPVADRGFVSVDRFYDRDDSISTQLEYTDQLPSMMMPIFDGEPGDFICISLQKDNYGKIFYWHHEGFVDQDIYLLANTFEEFILKLEIDNEDDSKSNDSESPKIIKATYSQKFLDMLKKDGFEPK